MIEPLDDQAVRVEVGAAAGQISVLRAVVADLAGRADFDLDAVEDLRLAVDEAAAQLVAAARPGARLSSSFTTTEGALEVRVAVDARAEARISTDSFGWRVLSTLCDELDMSTGDGSQLVIFLTKRHHASLELSMVSL